MLRLATALLLLSPALASAQCLTAESLDSGITVEYGSGSLAYLERKEDGTQVNAYLDVRGFDSYGRTDIFESVYGVFPLRDVSHYKGTWEAGLRRQFSYEFDLPPAEALVPGARGQGQITLQGEYLDPRTEAFGWSVYESAPLVIGDCTYPAVDVFTTVFSPYSGISFNAVKYLPEAGIGILTGNTSIPLPVSNAEITGLKITTR